MMKMDEILWRVTMDSRFGPLPDEWASAQTQSKMAIRSKDCAQPVWGRIKRLLSSSNISQNVLERKLPK